MESTKNTNYRIASWGGGELPKAYYQMQTVESLYGGGGKVPNVNYKISNANYQKLPTHSWGVGGNTKDN